MVIQKQTTDKSVKATEAKFIGGDMVIEAGEVSADVSKTAIEIPDDEYAVKVESVIPKEGEKGAYFELKLTIQDDPNYGGLHLWHRIFFTAKSMAQRQQALRALGAKFTQGADGKMHLRPDDLVGCWMGVKVVNQEWQGKKQPKVAACFSLADMGPAAVANNQEM